jgi:hypothetical protein
MSNKSLPLSHPILLIYCYYLSVYIRILPNGIILSLDSPGLRQPQFFKMLYIKHYIYLLQDRTEIEDFSKH